MLWRPTGPTRRASEGWPEESHTVPRLCNADEVLTLQTAYIRAQGQRYGLSYQDARAIERGTMHQKSGLEDLGLTSKLVNRQAKQICGSTAQRHVSFPCGLGLDISTRRGALVERWKMEG